MRKKLTTLIGIILLFSIICNFPVYAASVPKEDTPNYKVAFYAFECYHMQDENGKRYGYGYDMMQSLSNYLQCTFSYIGYEKSAAECVDMLRDGELDIYTAAKRTPERETEFAFSKHPAITAKTCMNVKLGNTEVVAGDYSTYDGLRIGLLERHTYNDRFIQFTKEKGFDCEIVYYETPTELSNALIDGEVDALVNSYIRTPEDEMTVEDFGETPYYFMARKEDQSLIDALDDAVDQMNIETPNWRSDLYNEYYGSQNSNTELTIKEKALLEQMRSDNVTVRAVMNPKRNPYSWYENGRARGIVADIFVATMKELGLKYEIVPVSTQQEYEELLADGDVDIWMDLDSYYEDEGEYKYKITEPYLTTTMSMVRRRGSTGKVSKIGVTENNIAIQEIISSIWPSAEIIVVDDRDECAKKIIAREIDGALMMSYSAQKVAYDDTQNRFRVEIVPGSIMELKMGVNAKDSRDFYGIWEKTLAKVAENKSAELVQTYLENSTTPTLLAYLFDRPIYLVIILTFLFVMILIVCLYIESVRSKNKQLLISKQLSEALMDAQKANDAKLNFFSKMSHDIRTPLNAVLGMTQIAQNYKDDPRKLDNALDNIMSEGNYLLTMINSILDFNQLEHGYIELINKPFNPDQCMRESVGMLQPLADKKEQTITVSSNFVDHVVVGDSARFSQIMVNIVSNAIKYTNLGGEIYVSLEALPANRYRFTCTDNGIGMTQEFIKHICEDYKRAEDSQISSTEGTGLGMAVVKGFTDLMKGTLQVESAPGKGSTFTVEITFAEPTIKEREQVELLDKQSRTPMNLKGKRVLLVEDNALNAEIAIELLQNIGFEIDWVENGALGVEKFVESELYTYAAIFMDMQMPVMSGIGATKQIRSLDREDSDIFIFAMTANTMTKDRKMCEDAGMNGYISKPISVKSIEDALKGISLFV